MCVCTPELKTPWCGKPGCEMPKQNPARVKKIKPDIASTPEMLLGMLKGDASQMKGIFAIVVWDDDSFQCVHSAMTLSQLSYGVHLFQLSLFEDMKGVL